MGHTRLGELPKGHKWKAVVAAMARRDDAPDVRAAATCKVWRKMVLFVTMRDSRRGRIVV